MKIKYDNSHVEKLCKEKKYALKHMELRVYNKLLSIINYIESATSLLDIKNYPSYRFHDLEGDDYKNQWTISIGRTGYRVHIIPLNSENNPIEKGDVLPQIQSIKIMLIKEISNHYGK